MKILHLVIYEKLYPPKNGGMLRNWNLTYQFNKHAELDLVTLQNDVFEKASRDGYCINASTKILFPPLRTRSRFASSQFLSAFRFRLFYGTFISAESSFTRIIPVLKSLRKNRYDVIVFEHLETLIAWKRLKKYFPSATFIFDAHNIDHILLDKKTSDSRVQKIKNLEKRLFLMFDQIWTCSEKDAEIVRKLNKNKIDVNVVPNGIDILRNPYSFPVSINSDTIIFCGSLDYLPNRKGLTWFLTTIWPVLTRKLQHLQLLIVGKGEPGPELTEEIKRNRLVHLIGEVKDVVDWYRKASLAIVPLLEGSGTRLKILEAMSLGVPVISTSVGAEGIYYTEGNDILIANSLSDWENNILVLLSDKRLQEKLSVSGRVLVEKEYSWELIGDKMISNINIDK